ncbi:hypothetical protein [Dactylosporangium sp. CA-233914]|uniref:hypothetical protein n=1 Tax=Dactylosporangium sp. CA-233914 TaxID=3239934 RepID=UPI003D8E2BC2
MSVLGVAILFGRSRFWLGIWPETGAAAQLSGYFLSVLAAGLAAWVAATFEVRGMQEQAASGAIRPATVEGVRFGIVLAWMIGPYLLVSLVAFVATAFTVFAPGVGMFFEYVGLGALMIVFGSAWGWLVGRLLAPIVGALSAALSWFIVGSLLGDSTSALRVSGPPWFALQADAFVIRAAALVVFAVSVILIPWKVSRRSFARGVVASIVALALVIGAFTATDMVRYRDPVAHPRCVQGAIEYCLWPEHAKYIPMVQAVDRRVSALPVKLALPSRIVDYSLSGSTQWLDLDTAVERSGQFPPEFDISEGSEWALARGVASAIVGEVFKDCSPSAKADPQLQSEQLLAWLEWRLAGGGTPDYRTNAPGDLQAAWSNGRRRAAELSDADQSAWVTALVADAKANYCLAA